MSQSAPRGSPYTQFTQDYTNPSLGAQDYKAVDAFHQKNAFQQGHKSATDYTCVLLPPLPLHYDDPQQTEDTIHVPFLVIENGQLAPTFAPDDDTSMVKPPDLILHIHKASTVDNQTFSGRVNVSLCSRNLKQSDPKFRQIERAIKALYRMPEEVRMPGEAQGRPYESLTALTSVYDRFIMTAPL
jgi:hypothetical protein